MQPVQKQCGLEKHPRAEYSELPHVKKSGFGNLGNLCFWNPEFKATQKGEMLKQRCNVTRDQTWDFLHQRPQINCAILACGDF